AAATSHILRFRDRIPPTFGTHRSQSATAGSILCTGLLPSGDPRGSGSPTNRTRALPRLSLCRQIPVLTTWPPGRNAPKEISDPPSPLFAVDQEQRASPVRGALRGLQHIGAPLQELPDSSPALLLPPPLPVLRS